MIKGRMEGTEGNGYSALSERGPQRSTLASRSRANSLTQLAILSKGSFLVLHFRFSINPGGGPSLPLP